MPLSRINTLKGLYGDMITTYVKKDLKSEFYDNNILMTYDIFELSIDSNYNVDNIVSIYNDLLSRNVTIRFEKSKQCDSDYLKAQLETLNVYNSDNMTKLLRLAIENYKAICDQELKLRRAMVENAKKNGRPFGNRKGSTRQTKKSIEAKKRIIEFSKSFDGTMKDIDLINALGLARNTYFKYKREIKIELMNKKEKNNS